MKTIYLINIENTNVYKIGVTKGDAKKRLENLQVGCPFPLVVHTVYNSKYGNKLEGILHRTYSLNKLGEDSLETFLPGVKLHGEWFYLSLDIVNGFIDKCREIEIRLDVIKNNTTLNNF